MFNRITEIPTRVFVRMQTALPTSSEVKSNRALAKVVPHTSKDRAAVALGAGLATVLYGLTAQAFAAGKYTGLAELIDNFTKFAMFLLIALSVLMAIAAGLMFVTSGGNQKVIGRAKETIKYVVIGIVLVLVLGVGKDVIVNLVAGATGGNKGASDAVSSGIDTRTKAAGAPPK